MWRSGSTFVWSRFRAAPGTYCYFEPLYAGLSRLTHDRIFGSAWRDAAAENRHPAMEAPYFAEYAPLVRGRGVKGFRRSFSFDRYALSSDDDHPALQTYIGELIGEAGRRGRIPVLGFNRSSLRMRWLKQRFKSFDVYVDRDPGLIWSSYVKHVQQGNYSYFNNLLKIMERNGRRPAFAPMARRLPLRSGLERLIKPKHVYRAIVETMAGEISYALVLYLWALGLLQALSCCDVVLDADLAGRPEYGRRLGRRISEGCGVPVDLGGLRRVGPAGDAVVRDRLAAERLVIELLQQAGEDFFDREAVERRLHEIAPEKADFLRQALDGAAHRRAA